MRILICGHRSFAATGLQSRLALDGHVVHGFSRGPEAGDGRVVTGDVFAIATNAFLESHYDLVVNFILIKNGSVAANVRYANALMDLCDKVRPRALLQVSSISAYPLDERHVTEETAIDVTRSPRGPYAAIKIAVDHAIEGRRRDFAVSYLRPGFIIDEGATPPSAGIALQLRLGAWLVLGDRRTTLPILFRSEFHEAICRIVRESEVASTYLLFANDGMTKASYVRRYLHATPISLPRSPLLHTAAALAELGLLSAERASQVRGLFRRTRFDSRATEARLQMRFRA